MKFDKLINSLLKEEKLSDREKRIQALRSAKMEAPHYIDHKYEIEQNQDGTDGVIAAFTGAVLICDYDCGDWIEEEDGDTVFLIMRDGEVVRAPRGYDWDQHAL